MDFFILLTITVFVLIISFISNRKKTESALLMAMKRFRKLLLPLLLMVLSMTIILAFISPELISNNLTEQKTGIAALTAALFGSIMLIPGFIAFPLGGILRNSGVPYIVIGAFTSTLMMVGIVTIPVERQYLGQKVAIVRNIIYLGIALLTALVTGIAYGEIFV